MQNLIDQRRDAILLVARVLLMVLFVVFGWSKLTGFAAAQAYMASTGAPLPAVAAAIAVVMELGVGVLLAVGLFTRPLAILLALYTLGTALIGHHFWTQTGTEQYVNMVNFYKNVSIIGGLLLLAVTGPGRYSFDRH
ncbi:DoxX family protein [Paraburkholderia rhizosphaerae]|uniref:Putative oxidoreductase n=1 Tax=Paraburkholderia rhizosphaerae TaxID=480658 RepID=A0A4R8LZF4_9BURK|nr:DoxX family protein [Paraburkholderia rhizosphaerae]TDY53962.1 putative oxidoreductase [Paraburkholderia rhizosphaerae]